MQYEINTAYKLINSQSPDEQDIYVINPFDVNGFLIRQIDIDVRLGDWNGSPILIQIPTISSLNSQYNFKINIICIAESVFRPRPLVLVGNEYDILNRDFIFPSEGIVITPVGLVGYVSENSNPNIGFYNVLPYSNIGRPTFSALSEEESVTPSTFKELYALSKNPV